MKTISCKLPDELASALAALARKRGVPKSELLREALEQYVGNGSKLKGVSCYDKAPDLAGSLDGGPSDLSYNKKHLAGFGE
ncbi:MAG: CopG family transcriptional regulator [Gemmataceae bacterium]